MSEPNRQAVLQSAAFADVAGVAGFVAFSLRDEGAADPAYTEVDAASSGQGTVLAAVDDIPDGGGVIVQDANVVVTRDGSSIQAFSAVCTHQGCTVASVQDGRISCACHGSVFDSGAGAVLQVRSARYLRHSLPDSHRALRPAPCRTASYVAELAGRMMRLSLRSHRHQASDHVKHRPRD